MNAATRSLWPREHGAYVQLGAPVIAAGATAPSLAALAWTIAIGAVFVLHEPLLVTLGHRGKRAVVEDGTRARRRLLSLTGIGLAAMSVAIWLAPPSLWWGAPALGGALVIAMLVHRRAERSLAGEIVVAATLAAAALPIAATTEVTPHAAALAWASWSLGFAAMTASVRALLPGRRGDPPRHTRLVFVATLLTIAGLGLVDWRAMLALPLWIAAIILVAVRPTAHHLRTIGVAFTVVAAATAALQIAAR